MVFAFTWDCIFIMAIVHVSALWYISSTFISLWCCFFGDIHTAALSWYWCILTSLVSRLLYSFHFLLHHQRCIIHVHCFHTYVVWFQCFCIESDESFICIDVDFCHLQNCCWTSGFDLGFHWPIPMYLPASIMSLYHVWYNLHLSCTLVMFVSLDV